MGHIYIKLAEVRDLINKSIGRQEISFSKAVEEINKLIHIRVGNNFELGSIAFKDGVPVRINAYRREVRPMGVFKIYEYTIEGTQEGGELERGECPEHFLTDYSDTTKQ